MVRKVCRERGVTVLFSAHELNQLIGTLDRVLYLGNGQAVLGTVDEVITAPVLSRLYGTNIHVVRADGHIFVMARGRDVEHVDHQHDQGMDMGIITERVSVHGRARPRPSPPRSAAFAKAVDALPTAGHDRRER